MKRKATGVPFFDLRDQYQSIKNEVSAAVQDVMDRCRFVLGENVNSFEKDFASLCGTEYAVGVANGTDALRLALLARGIGMGDEVITVPNTFKVALDTLSRRFNTKRIILAADRGMVSQKNLSLNGDESA